MAILTVTREYTPGSCRNSRNTMRLLPRRETRPDSPELHVEQFQGSNQTRNEPWFAWLNSRESSRTRSQDANDTDVTKGMWNCSVYSKWNRDDTRLPCIGSRAIPHSPSYKTGGLSYFRQLQRLTDSPVSNLEEHQIQHRNSRKAPWTPYLFEKRVDSQDSIEEIGHLSTSTSRVLFPQQ